MDKKSNFTYKHIYPRMRYVLSSGSKGYNFIMDKKNSFKLRPKVSSTLPNSYSVCNTSTIDSEFDLCLLEGNLPNDIDGSLYICQCLGSPKAYMVGDTNIVRIDFHDEKVHLKNRLIQTPATLAGLELKKTKYRFDYLGLMYLSTGLGLFSYTEGLYLLPDGRIAVTSDIDRPWVIDRENLRVETPVGKRSQWLPMMTGQMGEVVGNLFQGYNNSHVVYTDQEKGETFLVNYQYKAMNKEHPVNLIKWNGYDSWESFLVVDENGENIEIKQSIHELVFTRDYIILADTAFVTGSEFMFPWMNASLPSNKTVTYVIDRRNMKPGEKTVVATCVEINEPCIHLIPEYENPNDKITLYMLHTPATNTAEMLRSYDLDLNGKLFHKNSIGYGTLPVLDLSSIGKHIIDVKNEKVEKSEYIAEMPYCWGPYLYNFMGRQLKAYNGEDLFVMFKGFSKDLLPKRIYEAYKDDKNRRVPIEDMVGGEGINHNNSICRISTKDFKIVDSYVMEDKVLLYTITCLESNNSNSKGYVLAGVVLDRDNNPNTSGHEYWLFDAENLSKGPICKLGNKELNNSTLFHTLYIPSDVNKELDKKIPTYNISIIEDYPKEEVEKWDNEVLKAFEDTIWPYFDLNNKGKLEKIEKRIQQLSARRFDEHVGTEDIIGEERVVDAPIFAERIIEEAERMWKTTGWKVESENRHLVVESKPVSGAFESSGILVARCVGELNYNAQATFNMLISPEGYAVIDPVCKPEDHKIPPLEIYNWKDGARLEAARTTSDVPNMAKNEFVVLNAIDPERMIFASKSIIHDKCPGGSKYSNQPKPESGRERALNTFAIKFEPLDDTHCKVYFINYIDMSGKTGAKLNNIINTKMFFKPLYKRIEKAMRNK